MPKVPFEAAGANEYEGLGVCGVLGKGKGRPPLPCFPASAVSFEGVGSLVLGLPKVKPLFAVGGKAAAGCAAGVGGMEMGVGIDAAGVDAAAEAGTIRARAGSGGLS